LGPPGDERAAAEGEGGAFDCGDGNTDVAAVGYFDCAGEYEYIVESFLWAVFEVVVWEEVDW